MLLSLVANPSHTLLQFGGCTSLGFSSTSLGIRRTSLGFSNTSLGFGNTTFRLLVGVFLPITDLGGDSVGL
jgi:hypothetical protein